MALWVLLLLAAAVRAAPEEKAGDNDMGPFSASIAAAKAHWAPDACLSAMVYYYRSDVFHVEKGEIRSKLEKRSGYVEGYYYYFAVDSKPNSSPLVAYSDEVDTAFCIVHDRLKGPEFSESPKDTGSDCLTKVDVSALQAIGVAQKAGVDTGGDEDGVSVFLLSRQTWSRLYDKCVRGLSLNMKRWCAHALSKRQERLAANKDIWVVAAKGKQAFIDGMRPELLFTTNAGFELIPFQNTPAGIATTTRCIPH